MNPYTESGHSVHDRSLHRTLQEGTHLSASVALSALCSSPQLSQVLLMESLSFNEPDVDSQANMDSYYAADLYMQQIQPWTSKGTKLGSPAIV